MSPRRRRSVVLLGMMTRMPVPGVVWQTLHYLLGFRRLGYDVVYAEAHARAPTPFMRAPEDPGTAAAAGFLHDVLSPFDLGDRWAYHALHEGGECYGLGLAALRRAYRSADVIVNLHGGTVPLDEHVATGRLVLVATDPGRLEVELWERRPATERLLEAHCAAFTFGENYGRASGLPVSDRFLLRPTRQPVVLDLWETTRPVAGPYRTVANWRQRGREFGYRDGWYEWSKDLEFQKILDAPARSGLAFELALANHTDDDRARLEAHGWTVRPAAEFGTGPEPYRSFIQQARGELTAAKDQNVRLRTGWFSDRSATFLAAGRPVVTQDTGFGEVLPTGRGLFPFVDLDSALAALETIEADHRAACRAAADVARACFDDRVVLSRLLAEVGVEGPRAPVPAPSTGASARALGSDLVLEPVARRPLRLPEATLRALVERPLPEGVEPRVPLRDPRAAAGSSASVIVVTWENLALTRLCLETLLAHTRDQAFEVVVVDNRSTDGTRAYLEALAAAEPRVRLMLNDANEGFARACNQGARAAAGDVLVFLNNDTVLAPGWLSGLAEQLESPRVGAVNPVTNRIGTEAEVPERARTLGEFLEHAARRRSLYAGRARDVDMLALFCLALRRDVWERVGPLDEGFGRGLFEDDDYSMRLRQAGYRLVCAEDVLVHHLGEASFGRLVPDGTYGALFERNRRRFEAKWGRAWERASGGADEPYQMLIERIRATVRGRLPAGATVAVVSRGDDALLQLDSLKALHFPRGADGRWAGHYPVDDAAAVAQLEAVRRSGADYLLLPRPAFWWLDHYAGLRRHLVLHGEEVTRTPDLCLYRLADASRQRGAEHLETDVPSDSLRLARGVT